MPRLVLQSEIQTPIWRYGGDLVYFRIYASTSFYGTDGEQVTGGAIGSPNWYQQYECEINEDGNVVLPQVIIQSTTDSSVPTARYTALFYSSTGRRIQPYKLANFFVDPDYLESNVESSVSVSGAGTASANDDYTYRGVTNNRNYYNRQDYDASTTLNAVYYTGTEWRITDTVGARLYYSTEDEIYPWDCSTWIADAGAADPPNVNEDPELIACTWEWLTMANQGSTPYEFPLNTYYTIPQVNALISRNQDPIAYASEIVAGKTYLSQDPALSTNPIAVGVNDTVWQEINVTYWLSDYASLAAALADIGSTQARLKITQQCSVTGNTTIPSTTLIDIDGDGSFTVSGGVTLTIGSMIPIAPYRVFYGSGSVVFSKNATGGKFQLAWWTGVSNSGDCTAAFTQATTSLTNNTGGELFVGPGVWKMDGMTVPSGSWVIGSGQNTNITSGTVIKPFSTSAIDLFTFSSGFKRSGLKNLTVTTDGTVSASSRDVRVLGNATSAFGLTFDEVHFAATLTASELVNFDDVGSNNYEIVDVLFNHCIWEVPTNGTAIKWESNNTLTTLVQPSIICAAGAKCYHVGQAGGGGGWIEVISGDERGPGSFASSTSTDRSITGSIDGGTGVLTATSGAFVQNDVGQPFTRGAATGYITGLLTATTCDTDYSGASIGAGTLTMSRLTPSTSMAYCVWHIVGDHNTINIIGGADEGFQYFLINEAPTNVSPINVTGRTIQSTVSIEDPCVLTFRNCALKSQTFIDDAAVTGTLFFDGCSWNTTTVNLVGSPALQSIVLDAPRVWGVHDGASIVYTDLSFHEGEQKQSFEVQTEFLDRRDGALTPLAVFASSSNSDQPAVRVGRLEAFTQEVDHYYDIFRDAAVDGYLQFAGSQAFPNRGYNFDANVEAVTFKGTTVSPSQITSNQNNYPPANSSYLIRLSTDASRNITGLTFTVTQKTGEMHEIVNVGSFNIVLVNQSGLSDAANRFLCDTGADITVLPNERCKLTYDGTTARWRVSKLNISGVTSNGTTVDIAALLTGTSLDLSGNLGVTGSTTLDNALTVNAVATFNDDLDAGTVNVSTKVYLQGGADLEFAGTTGQPKILLTDNLANALAVAESSNDYLRFVTTNSSEAIHALKSLLSISATAGMGYGTGAGSAVTQGTNRTTAVTINAVCGAITLFSAAGSTTPASFTVNNSVVAATDTIILNQKSGTDKYDLSVTAVGAGSFEITFNTKSGTTVEQPVINFSVVKAVAA